jgi:RNA polymerase sigma-70 factor (ECF subfamily)
MDQHQIQDLIESSKRGDTRAFEKLVVEFQPLLFRLAFRLLCNDDDAKDTVQEVFIKIWLQLGRYQSRYRFSTWIYKIACNACYDRLRSVKHFSSITEIPDIASPDNADAPIVNDELRELILYYTGQLSPMQKLVFTLKDIEELEVNEIVAITGLSAGKIKSNLHLARKQIKEKLNTI